MKRPATHVHLSQHSKHVETMLHEKREQVAIYVLAKAVQHEKYHVAASRR